MKDLATFLTYSGISTILFLILLLHRTWKKRKANKILASILLSFLLLFLTFASSYLNWFFLTTIVAPIGIIVPFAIGSLIFHYIKTIYTSKIDLRRLTRSLIPFGITFVIYSVPQYAFELHPEDKLTTFQIIWLAIPFLGILHFAYYLFLSHKLLKRFRKSIKNNYANLIKLDLKWLSIWIWGFSLFLGIDMISGVMLVIYPDYSTLVHMNLFYLVLLIWYIGYYGVNQTQVFLVEEMPVETIKKKGYQKKTIQSTSYFNCESKEFIEIKSQLDFLFLEKELYKNQEVSLKLTADMLNISDKKLSYVLNICLDSNFYEYVNMHRVDYIRKKIAEGASDKLTFLGIAFDSGFNSKATFNRVFKQKVGMTPKEFKKLSIKRSQRIQ